MKGNMLRNWLCAGLGLLWGISAPKAQEKLHVLKINSPADVSGLFRYTGKERPLIAGHRGSVENGMPENSIEGFEYTLRHTPAFFEIDPRLTKDSIIVLMHDATLDRTTTGKGKVSDYTYAELQKLNLKDAAGNPTPFKIPTLASAIEWARGKTILNLDDKGVPYAMIAALIKKHRAESFVIITVHSPEHARYYLGQNKSQFFSAFIKTPADFEAYDKAGIPFRQLLAYIGPHVKESNREMYRLLHARGAMAMISAASSYDKLATPEARKAAYQSVIRDGASILESDYPVEAARAVGELKAPGDSKRRFLGRR